MATNLPPLANVEQLSKNVIRVMGGNPSKFTLQGSNTYLLGRGPSRILLDTGQGFPAWKENLSSALQAHSATVSTCLLSHWHHDHIGGLADLLDLCPDAKVYKHKPTLDPDGILRPHHHHKNVLDISDGQVFSVDGPEDRPSDRFAVKALYTPGHTEDHMSFVVVTPSSSSSSSSSADSDADKDEDIGAMFTGDNVLGHGTAVFEDLAVYLASLHRMADAFAPHPDARAYPAHGAVLENGRATVEMYIKHRQQREDEALRVLRTGRVEQEATTEEVGVSKGEETPKEWWGSMEMVKVIYKDVPESLHGPAEGGLLQVLRKLVGEGKVEKGSGGKWRLGKKAVL